MSERVRRADFARGPEDRRRGLTPSRARRAPSPRALARRRAMVRALTLLLPMLAAALLALLVFWPEFEGRDSRLAFRRGGLPLAEALVVVQPHYQGTDELNRPYTVTAREARVAAGGGENEVLLDAPEADILLEAGAWVFAESRAGRFDRAERVLDLEGDVTVFHENGLMVRTEAANLRIPEGAASGDRPTAAQGPFGTIDSEGFEIRERGAVVVFTGRARAVLEPRP